MPFKGVLSFLPAPALLTQRAAGQGGLMPALCLVGVCAVVVWSQNEIGSASDALPV